MEKGHHQPIFEDNREVGLLVAVEVSQQELA